MGVTRYRVRVGAYIPKASVDMCRLSVFGSAPQLTRWPTAYNLSLGDQSCADQTHPGPPYREGGPLDVWKVTVGPYVFDAFDARSNTNPPNQCLYHYWGNWYLNDGLLRDLIETRKPVGWGTTWGDGSGDGAKGWNKYKPGKPGADLSVFLAELRDLPRMFRVRLRRFKDLGSQYLNYQFGWKPFVNDLCKFFNQTQRLANRLRFLRNNNGKWVRRGGPVSNSTNSWTEEVPFGILPVLTSSFYPSPSLPKAVLRWTDSKQTWFEASFRFWIPNIEDPEWIADVSRRLYGLNLSPEVVWELIPWSWLIDWFTNVGDIMSNLSESSAAENLVAKYAYVMTHSRLRVEVDQTFVYKRIVSPTLLQTVTCKTYVEHERKQRVEASPYGFDLSWPDFTARQLAILAALGITRLL